VHVSDGGVPAPQSVLAGYVTFWEPTITKAFIESVKHAPSQTASFSIPQPQAVEKAGFDPGHYTVRYDAAAQTYEIILGNLTERPAVQRACAARSDGYLRQGPATIARFWVVANHARCERGWPARI
jgi:hypothetical protein